MTCQKRRLRKFLYIFFSLGGGVFRYLIVSCGQSNIIYVTHLSEDLIILRATATCIFADPDPRGQRDANPDLHTKHMLNKKKQKLHGGLHCMEDC